MKSSTIIRLIAITIVFMGVAYAGLLTNIPFYLSICGALLCSGIYHILIPEIP